MASGSSSSSGIPTQRSNLRLVHRSESVLSIFFVASMPMEAPNLAYSPPSWASHTSKRLRALALTARNVSREPTHMAHRLLSPFASYLFELARVLQEMQREAESEASRLPVSITRKMDAELKAAEQLIDDYVNRCNLYLLMCCPELMMQLKTCYSNLKAILESFSQDEAWSDFLRPRLASVNQLQDESCSLRLGLTEQTLHDSLEQGMLDSIIVNSSLAVKLARQIAECLGLSLESEGFAVELTKLKTEKAHAEMRKGKAHSLYLEQFIVLLDKAVAATTNSANGEAQDPAVASSPAARDTLVLPLQSFVCPITKDVMRDPVQIASGQTYERSAIVRWFEEGHTRCPTGVKLANTKMESNFALRQAIAEWKERNNNIRLEKASDMIRSDEKEQQLKALQELEEVCEEDSLNKYKVASLMPALVHLAESSDLEVRKKAFTTLGLVAKDNAENQEIMVKEKVIAVTVRCLARQCDEAPDCVRLLRLLSGNPAIAAKISRSQSAVLFLVTLIQDGDCGEDVKAILENLPTSDENAVIMAEANIMEQLISRLNEGESSSKVRMAKTLGRLHMPESSKAVVATEESIRTLAALAESAKEDEREAGVAALENLSTVAAARRWLQQCCALTALLKIVKGVPRQSEAAKRSSAATYANILASSDYILDDPELDDTVCTFLQLLEGSTTPPSVKLPLLQGLYGLARGSSAAARQKLKDCDAFTFLLQLLNRDDATTSASLRSPCLDLLACLAAEFGTYAAQSVLALPTALSLMVDLVKDERHEPREVQAVTSLLASLPIENREITPLLINADVIPALIKHFNYRGNETLAEAAAGALLRFTLPDNQSMQHRLADVGVIQTYVNLLRSGGSVGKERAALALSFFSYNSRGLSEPVRTASGGMLGCLAGGGRRRRAVKGVCLVHGGRCSVESTFCLVEAGAVAPLVAVLKEETKEAGAIAAALMALTTLVEVDDAVLPNEGFAAIDREQGLGVIINLMSNETPQVQELAAKFCELLFNLPKYRVRYAAQAQMHIIQLAQNGSPNLRHLAGRLLRHMELLQSQSSYFGLNSAVP